MSSFASKFFAAVILTQALGGSTYVSQLEGQAEPVDPAVNLASEHQQMAQ